ncbi:MAG: flagellar assembly protein FliW [Pirellulales bacterium]
MQIETRKFGWLAFTLEDVLVIPDGLLDYPAQRRWLLLGDACHEALYWLQSLDEAELAIPVVDCRNAGVHGYDGVSAGSWAELQDETDPPPVALVRLQVGSGQLDTRDDRPILINPIRRVGRQVEGRPLQVSQAAPPEQLVPLRKAA